MKKLLLFSVIVFAFNFAMEKPPGWAKRKKPEPAPEHLQVFFPQKRAELKAFMTIKSFDFPQYHFTYPTLPDRGKVYPDKMLKALINAEKNKVYMAIYLFNITDIAQDLIKLKKRGKEVIVIVDKIYKERPNTENLIKSLIRNGIQVFSPRDRTMHAKFILFFDNVENKQLLWRGSWNNTYSASTINFETFEITDDAEAFQKYLKYFEYIKDQSTLIE